jgi:hypothetical protein
MAKSRSTNTPTHGYTRTDIPIADIADIRVCIPLKCMYVFYSRSSRHIRRRSYEHIEAYLNLNKKLNKVGKTHFEEFPTFETWIGRTKVPSGDTLRRHYAEAYFAKGSAAHEENPEASRYACCCA